MHTKKTFISKVFSLLLTLLMVLTIVPSTVFAVSAPNDTWDNHAANSFEGGNGTAGNPYQIANAAQLAYLSIISNTNRDQTRGTYYKLTDNIDLSAYRFIPIGQEGWNTIEQQGSFMGYFNGNSKTITGLYVDESSTDCYAGLFGDIAGETANADAIIKDLTIKDAYISTAALSHDESTAGILSGNFGTFSNNRNATLIKNVNVSGIISRGNGKVITGGLIGSPQFVTIQNCSANITINSKPDNIAVNGNAGGLLGKVCSVKVENCTASGTIDGAWALGGFVGEIYEDSTFTHCVANTAINGNDWNLGGFVGYIGDSQVNITNCIATGNVKSTLKNAKPKAGGFCGTNNATISNSYAVGTVTGSHASISVGGFVGYDVSGTTNNCMFDVTKNPSIPAIGQTESGGNNTITAKTTSEVLSAICENIYGGHKAVKVDAKAATSTADGNIEYWYCSNCDKYFSDETLTKEITKAQTIIGKTGHSNVTVNENEEISTIDDNITVATPPATTKNPNPPTQATATINTIVTNNTANVIVSQSIIDNAINKAQEEAKKNGTEKNGITVEIKADTKNSSAKNLSANLPKVVIDALVKKDVKEFHINSGVVTINLDLEALKTIQKENGNDVTVSAKKVDNNTLSAEAKAVVGSHPVFDFSITGTNGTKVTNFGDGKIFVSIPYTLGTNEKAENVIAYYIDNEGKVQEMPNSVYNQKTKTLSFVTNHFSKYAVGYKVVKANPQTGDTNSLNLRFGITLLMSAIIIALFAKKKLIEK